MIVEVLDRQTQKSYEKQRYVPSMRLRIDVIFKRRRRAGDRKAASMMIWLTNRLELLVKMILSCLLLVNAGPNVVPLYPRSY